MSSKGSHPHRMILASAVISLGRVMLQVRKAAKPQSNKNNATKHGKPDHLTMANNIGRRCTTEVAEGCILEQNRPLIPFLPSAEAADPAIDSPKI